jgi:uncharacterized FlaG/YvyC family protein
VAVCGVDQLDFEGHARDEGQHDSVSKDELALVVGDYDDKIERDDGRTEYSRMLDDGRWVVVVLEDDGETVVTLWWDRRRSRRQGMRRRR